MQQFKEETILALKFYTLLFCIHLLIIVLPSSLFGDMEFLKIMFFLILSFMIFFFILTTIILYFKMLLIKSYHAIVSFVFRKELGCDYCDSKN